MPEASTTPPPTEPFTLSADSRRVFVGLMIGMFVASVSQTIVGPAMPRIVAELGGMEHYSWVATAAMLVSAISVPIVGKLSDLFGRRPFYLAGLVVFLVGSIVSGTAQNFWWLVAGRAIQGLGMGTIMPLSQTIIGDVIPPRQRGKYQGYMGAIFGLTSVAGPLAGGLITDLLGWRWLFFVATPIGLAALFVIGRFLKLPYQRRDAPIDAWGIITLTIALTSILLATSWGGTSYPWASPQVLGLYGLGAVALVLFVGIELRFPEPVIPLRLFTNGVFTSANIAAFGVSMIMFGSIIYIPIYAQGVLGADATGSGLILMPLMLFFVVVGIAAGLLITRTGRYKELMLTGVALIGVGIYLLTRLAATSSSWELSLAMVVLGTGLGLCNQQYTLVVQNAATRRDLGVATAATQFFRNVGSTVGIAVLGTVLTGGLAEAIGRHLPPELASHVPSGAASVGAVLDPAALAALPPQVAAAVREGLADQLHNVFLVCLPLVVIVFAATLAIKPIALRDTVGNTEDASRELLDTMSSSSVKVGEFVPALHGAGPGERTRERLLGLQLAIVADSAMREDRPLLRQAIIGIGDGDLARGLTLLHCTAEMLTSDDPDVAASTERYACALADQVTPAGLLGEGLRQRIALAAADAPKRALLEDAERPLAERHEAVDISKLREAASDLTAALLVDIAADRRG